MVESTGLPLNLYYVLETGQNSPAPGELSRYSGLYHLIRCHTPSDSAPYWIEKLVDHGNQHVNIYPGVGTRNATSSTSPLLQFLYLPIRLGQQLTGYGMSEWRVLS